MNLLTDTFSYRVVLQATETHEQGHDRDGEAIMISLHTQINLIEFVQRVWVSLLRLFHAQFGQDDDVSLDESLQEFRVQRHLHDDAEYENNFFVRLLFCIDKSSKKVNRSLKRHMVSGSRCPIDDIIVLRQRPLRGRWFHIGLLCSSFG